MAILNTRPDQVGKQLSEMLTKSGLANIHLPFININAGSQLNDLPNKINQLNAGDIVFCVSKNAAKYACDSLQNAGFHWRKDLHYVAVGKASAECFSSLGEISVHYPISQENSEGVLDLPIMQDLKDKTILILRGNGGREFFAEEAEKRAAKIGKLECYQRVSIEYNNAEQVDLCKRSGINKILVTSGEILKALLKFVPENEQNWLKGCQLITVSQRIADLALEAGWQKQNIIITAKADNVSIINALSEL